jgi:hypothetical protein
VTQPAMTVEGDERLAMTARAAARDLADMDTANRAVGEVVRARAASKAPKVTGRLAGSVRADATASEVVVYSDLAYAPPINYGWPAHNIAAQPFMSDALNEATNLIVDRYANEVADDVRQVKGA